MTRIKWKEIECGKCGHISTQMLICSVNIVCGDEERCEALLNHKQQCPKCGYTALDISEPEWPTDEDIDELMEVAEGDSNEECLKLLDGLVEKEMEEYDLFVKDENDRYVRDDNGEKTTKFGACNTKWQIQKDLMQEIFGRDWESPADKYPGVFFD